MAKRVTYYHDPKIGYYNYGKRHCMQPVRMEMTDSIGQGLGLYESMDVITPIQATPPQLESFHNSDYIRFLQDVTTINVKRGGRREKLEQYGLDRKKSAMECPIFTGLFEFCKRYTGGTLAGALKLAERGSDICVNWSGGLHHAQPGAASGFCYVNDCVIGMKTLLDKFDRILYLDIDVHQSDATQVAFNSSNRVMHVSFHRFDGFFFPGTGSVREVGEKIGRNYSINVPLFTGIDDESYGQIFNGVMERVMAFYRPQAIVFQAGADSLSGDLTDSFNLSIECHAGCLRFALKQNLPILVLGGGGYTPELTSKCWAYETSVLVGRDNEFAGALVPDSTLERFRTRFQAPYDLHPRPIQMENKNSKAYLALLLQTVVEQLRMIEHAPSVGITDDEFISNMASPSVDGSYFSNETRELIRLELEGRRERHKSFNPKLERLFI